MSLAAIKVRYAVDGGTWFIDPGDDIASARQDIVFLVAEVERLRAALVDAAQWFDLYAMTKHSTAIHAVLADNQT